MEITIVLWTLKYDKISIRSKHYFSMFLRVVRSKIETSISWRITVELKWGRMNIFPSKFIHYNLSVHSNRFIDLQSNRLEKGYLLLIIQLASPPFFAEITSAFKCSSYFFLHSVTSPFKFLQSVLYMFISRVFRRKNDSMIQSFRNVFHFVAKKGS